MRAVKKWKPRVGYNEYRHTLWEVVRFPWVLAMMPNVLRSIARNRHEFSRGQVRVLKKTISEQQ